MSARPGPSGGYHAEWYPYRDLKIPRLLGVCAAKSSVRDKAGCEVDRLHDPYDGTGREGAANPTDRGNSSHGNASKQQYNIDLYLICRIELDNGRLRFYN